MATKTYSLGVINTLKLQCNFTSLNKIPMFITESAITSQKIPFSREHFYEYGDKPILMFRVEGSNIDPSYNTNPPSKSLNTNLIDYFNYVTFPSNFDADTMEVVLCIDRGIKSADCILSDASLSSKIFVQRDKHGVNNVGTSGCMYILDRETREVIASSENPRQIQWGETYYPSDIFLSMIQGEPTYRTVEEMNGTLVIQGIDKIFSTKDDALYYIETGEELNRLDEEEEPEEEKESEVYFYEVYNEYYSDLALTNHILTTNQKYTITFEDFPKGTTPIHAQLINNKYMNNVQFIVANGYGQYITSASSRIGNIEVPITTDILSTFMAIRTNYGILEDTVNDRYCKTVVYTNMPIIGVDGVALPGRIPDSDDMISAENGADYDCGLSECWLLNTENVQKLASIFNTTINKSGEGAVTAVVAEWLQGLSCYSNPLDVVCDLFYMPINVDDFVTGTNRSFKLQQDFFDD